MQSPLDEESSDKNIVAECDIMKSKTSALDVSDVHNFLLHDSSIGNTGNTPSNHINDLQYSLLGKKTKSSNNSVYVEGLASGSFKPSSRAELFEYSQCNVRKNCCQFKSTGFVLG